MCWERGRSLGYIVQNCQGCMSEWGGVEEGLHYRLGEMYVKLKLEGSYRKWWKRRKNRRLRRTICKIYEYPERCRVEGEG